MVTTLLLLTLAQVDFPTPPTAGEWELAKCTRLANGNVHCDEVAFTALTGSLIDAEASVSKLTAQLTARDVQLEALRAALAAKPAPVAPMLKVKPIIAVATAVLGTMAVTAAAGVTTLSPEARVALGITGAAAVAGSFVIVF